jgi:hypothetical protein
LVTRVAALFEEEEELPCFFGEIFFSGIRVTPFTSRPLRAWPNDREYLPGAGSRLCRPSLEPP